MFEVDQLIKEKTLEIKDEVAILNYYRMKLENILIN